jgi:hypothetical protein
MGKEVWSSDAIESYTDIYSLPDRDMPWVVYEEDDPDEPDCS